MDRIRASLGVGQLFFLVCGWDGFAGKRNWRGVWSDVRRSPPRNALLVETETDGREKALKNTACSTRKAKENALDKELRYTRKRSSSFLDA